jgi:hypothetical protein
MEASKVTEEAQITILNIPQLKIIVLRQLLEFFSEQNVVAQGVVNQRLFSPSQA